MQRSSETIATIAAALGEARAQLVNPRYTPLSSGLDIVRNTKPE
jgi:hypothetical protein